MAFLADSQPPRRKPLAVYPIILFYVVIGWMILYVLLLLRHKSGGNPSCVADRQFPRAAFKTSFLLLPSAHVRRDLCGTNQTSIFRALLSDSFALGCHPFCASAGSHVRDIFALTATESSPSTREGVRSYIAGREGAWGTQPRDGSRQCVAKLRCRRTLFDTTDWVGGGVQKIDITGRRTLVRLSSNQFSTAFTSRHLLLGRELAGERPLMFYF